MTGPLVVAVAAWCAAGIVTVATADSAVTRIAVPAPWWVAVLAGAAALLVPGWRRPITAVPALLAVLPWLPIPLPIIALVWTGPLAWVPIVFALLAAILASRAARDTLTEPERRPMSPAAHTWAAAALTTVLAIGTAALLSPRLPAGDEPHYLVITQSLLQDGDLEITNNHAARDYAAYFDGDLRPDFLKRGARGEAYSIHAPGVPAIVLPAFAAFGYRGAQATIVLLAALTAALIWRIGWRATGGASAGWFAWAALVLTPTFLIQGVTIFPDGPGAIGPAAAIWLLLRLRDRERPPSMAALAGVSLVLAALPWMHTRFAVLAGGFGAAIVVQIVMSGAVARARRLAAFAVVPAASAAAWFASFYVMYGTADPTAPYGPAAADRSLAFAPGAILGLFFDQQFGLVAFAPVLLAAAVGIVAALRGPWRFAPAASGLTALAYLVATGTYWMWWAGVPAPPARFLTAVLPAFALPIAVAWQRLAVSGRTVLGAALLWSAAVTAVVLGVQRGELAWSVRDGQAAWLDWLNPVVNLPRGWPSFFWRLTPPDVSTEWPFAVHALVWLAAIAAAAAVVFIAGRRARTPAGQITTLASGVLIGVMTSVQAGWWINQTNGLDPARSQFAVIGAAGKGQRPWQLGAFEIVRPPGRARVTVRPEEPPRFQASPPLAVFDGVPPGEYGLAIAAERSQAGELLVRDGDVPIATLALAPVSRQTLPLSLPEGAKSLIVERTGPAPAGAMAVELVVIGEGGR